METVRIQVKNSPVFVLSFLLYRKLRFWSSQKKERMFIEHTLDKHAFGYDNKTLAGSEDIETFFAKTIVKWIIFI